VLLFKSHQSFAISIWLRPGAFHVGGIIKSLAGELAGLLTLRVEFRELKLTLIIKMAREFEILSNTIVRVNARDVASLDIQAHFNVTVANRTAISPQRCLYCLLTVYQTRVRQTHDTERQRASYYES
jgi:hypothetical protein